MKYLYHINEFKLINESRLYFSTNFREKLKNIDHPIAKELLKMEFTDVNPDMTFIDLESEEGYISFIQMQNAIKKVKKEHPDMDLVKGKVKNDKVFNITKNEVDFLYRNDIHDLEISTGVFTESRNKIKIGKFVNKVFPEKFTDKQIEEFVNKFKAESTSKNEFEFELVNGNEIAKWYACKNYSSDSKGTLGNSCMKYSPTHDFDIFTENPEVCSMLILKNDNNKLVGRALVWKVNISEDNIKDNPELKSVKYFMDRIYYTDDYIVDIFKNYAKEQGWAYKASQDYEIQKHIIYKGNPYFVDMKVKLKESQFDNYPYLDTFGVLIGHTLYNSDSTSKSGAKILRNELGYPSNYSWSNRYDKAFPEDEVVYSHEYSDYIPKTHAVDIDGEWYAKDDDDVRYVKDLGRYFLLSDMVYIDNEDILWPEEFAISYISKISIDGDDKGIYIEYSKDDPNWHNIILPWEDARNLLWYKKLNSALEKYPVLGIHDKALEKDYKGDVWPKFLLITTYKTKDGKWMSKEDIDNTLLTNKSRREGILEYYKRELTHKYPDKIDDIREKIKSLKVKGEQLNVLRIANDYVMGATNEIKSFKNFKQTL